MEKYIFGTSQNINRASMIVCNALPLAAILTGMSDSDTNIRIHKISGYSGEHAKYVRNILADADGDDREFISAVGHADIAGIISDQIGADVPHNRINIQFRPGDWMIVAQYIGPRLPEGALALPEEAKIEYVFIENLGE